jgi:hypothetical protein
LPQILDIVVLFVFTPRVLLALVLVVSYYSCYSIKGKVVTIVARGEYVNGPMIPPTVTWFILARSIENSSGAGGSSKED